MYEDNDSEMQELFMRETHRILSFILPPLHLLNIFQYFSSSRYSSSSSFEFCLLNVKSKMKTFQLSFAART